MPDLVPFLPLILAIHVTLAIALFVPGLLLPFTLRRRPPGTTSEPSALVRLLTWGQSQGSLAIGAGLAVTGLAMVGVLGTRIVEQPWLLASLVVYAITAAVVVVQGPALRRLRGAGPGASDAARVAWTDRARQQRYIAYGVTGAVGFIGYLMSTKPELW